MSYLDKLKKKKSKNFEELNDKLNKMKSGGFKDENYWKLEVDKAGNGFAIIRFLPAPENEEFEFVQMWRHAFQGSGGWYIEPSLTTLGKDDPVSEFNSKLWNSGVEANKEIARKQKRKLEYHSNIYVVKDPANPQNEGKVFKYQFGAKIFDKITEAMNPPEMEDADPINPFSIFEDGANFKLRAKNGDGGFRTYEGSSFDSPKPISNAQGEELDENEIEEVLSSMHSLADIVSPDKFKSYDELKARLNKVLKLDEEESAPSKSSRDRDDEGEENPKTSKEVERSPDKEASPSNDEEEDFLNNLSMGDDEDEDDFFKSLADDD